MRILALDSSGMVASVAVVEEEEVIAEYTVNYKKTHSQTLLPMLDEISKQIELDLSTIDAIGVAAGPGSFTGLRIGSATAKGLGLALDKPIVPVPTVEGLAYNLYGVECLVCPLMDARRNQVYTGLYTFEHDRMITVTPQKAVGITEMIEEINQINKPVIFLGDGVSVYKEVIKEQTQVPFRFTPPHLAKQRAAAIGALALLYYKAGRTEHAREHKPEYLRLSQAERERMEKMKQKKEKHT